jgi:uncharacterized protein YjbI with pentapeptide repeats
MKPNPVEEDLTEMLKSLSVDDPLAAQNANTVFQNWKVKHNVTEIKDYIFRKRNLTNVHFRPLSLENVAFLDCILNGARFEHQLLDRVKFLSSDERGTLLQTAKFNGASLIGAKLADCDLQSANFTGAKLTRCDLSNSDLRDAQFEHASLVECDLRGIQVSSHTSFLDLIDASGSTIDKYTLACLGKERGYLTDGNLMKMNIVDDVAMLRNQFGGYWTIFHLAAILIFVFPYVWFLLSRWAEASFRPPIEGQPTMALWEALLRFIVTGGHDWRHSWTPRCSLIVFLLFLFYNAARAALLWKTTKLKMQQDITGLPVEFSLQSNSRWQDVYKFTVQGFWWAVVLAIVNTILFLTMRIPIN